MSPGRWVITSNKGEAESLFRDFSIQPNPNQGLLKIKFYNVIQRAYLTECGDRDQRNNGHVGESHKEDKRDLREEEHLECARKRNHKSCRFISN